MASPAYTPLGEQLPDSASEGDNSEIREEVGIDLTPESVDPDQIVIKVSVTNGGAVLETFDYPIPKTDTTVADFKKDLETRLEKLEVKLRMLIYRGQVLTNAKKLSEYKFRTGETLQLLTWIPESTAAAATQQAAAQAAAAVAPGVAPGVNAANRPFQPVPLEEQQRVFAFQTGLTQGMLLQEEVEQWSARVKVWTCMLMLIYSFELLVGMSQSVEAHQQHSSKMALSFLGFWVAYIGLRGASRYNFSLARGYLFGSIGVALCNLFLMAIRDPSVMPQEHSSAGHDNKETPREVSSNVLFLSFTINVVFWAYIVYCAYRYQRALLMWLQDGAPEHIVQSQEEV